MPLTFIVLVQVVWMVFKSAVGDNCSFPLLWQTSWWQQTDQARNQAHYVIYTAHRESSYVVENITASGECTSIVQKGEYHYYVRSDVSANTSLNECVQIYTGSVILIRSVANFAMQVWTAEDCAAQPDYAYNSSMVLVRKGAIPSVVCPIAVGSYHATVNIGEGDVHCEQNAYSRIVVDGSISINTCLDNSTYDAPFSEVRLTCIEQMLASSWPSQPHRAWIVRLEYMMESQDNLPRYYFLDYLTNTPGFAHFKLDGRKSGTLQLNTEVADKFTYTFTLSSDGPRSTTNPTASTPAHIATSKNNEVSDPIFSDTTDNIPTTSNSSEIENAKALLAHHSGRKMTLEEMIVMIIVILLGAFIFGAGIGLLLHDKRRKNAECQLVDFDLTDIKDQESVSCFPSTIEQLPTYHSDGKKPMKPQPTYCTPISQTHSSAVVSLEDTIYA